MLRAWSLIFRERHAERNRRVDRPFFAVERLAKFEPVPSFLHHDAEHERGVAVATDDEGRRILVASFYFRDVA